MKTLFSFAGGVGLIAACLIAFAQQESPLQVSPQTLLLNAVQSDVTVHAAEDYVRGCPAYIVLDDKVEEAIEAKATFADSRGELVAKFDETDVKRLVSVPAANIKLYYGGQFIGSTTVAVREWASKQ